MGCDVTFPTTMELPLGCAAITMGVDDVARAGEACGAELIVPIHWGEPHGSEEDIEQLRSLFSRNVGVLERQS